MEQFAELKKFMWEKRGTLVSEMVVPTPYIVLAKARGSHYLDGDSTVFMSIRFVQKWVYRAQTKFGGTVENGGAAEFYFWLNVPTVPPYLSARNYWDVKEFDELSSFTIEDLKNMIFRGEHKP